MRILGLKQQSHANRLYSIYTQREPYEFLLGYIATIQNLINEVRWLIELNIQSVALQFCLKLMETVLGFL
jgi:hypothetical protein